MKRKMNKVDEDNQANNIAQTHSKRGKKNGKIIKSEESKDEANQSDSQNIFQKCTALTINEEYLSYTELIKTNLESFSIKPKYINKGHYNTDVLQKISKITHFTLISPLELYYKIKYEDFHKLSHEQDKCTICLCDFYDDLKEKSLEQAIEINNKTDSYDVLLLNNCTDHFFHIECLDNMIGDKDFIKCPNCTIVYGTIIGDQPKGTMKVSLMDYPCTGYEDCSTICIYYQFPSGKTYSGTSREAYLPNNSEGREVLALLKVAFDRKLTFTVGTSVTTGCTNTTIWNGVHHKTNLSGGSAYFGYPDPTYFNRVKQELAVKGVKESDVKDRIDEICDELIPKAKTKKGKK
jgi:hypothetical protein